MKNNKVREFFILVLRVMLIFLIINSIFFFGISNRIKEKEHPSIFNDIENMERFYSEYGFEKGYFYSILSNFRKMLLFDFNQSYYGNITDMEDIYTSKFFNSFYLLSLSLIFVFIAGYFLIIRLKVGGSNIIPILFTKISLVFFSLFLIYMLSIKFNIFPLSGKVSPFFEELGFFRKITDMFMHAFLPVFSLTAFFLSIFIRRGQKIKDLKEYSLVFLSDMRFILPSMISIQILIENIFIWPGLGMLFYTTLKTQDMPVLYCLALYFPVFIFIVNQSINIILRKYEYEI